MKQAKLKLPLKMIKKVFRQLNPTAIKVFEIRSVSPKLVKKVSEMTADEIYGGVKDDKYLQIVSINGTLEMNDKTLVKFQAICRLKNQGGGWEPDNLEIKYENEKNIFFYRFESTFYQSKKRRIIHYEPVKERR